MLALEADHPTHLPLPRQVGPYTVVRFTTQMSCSDYLVMLGVFQNNKVVTTEVAPVPPQTVAQYIGTDVQKWTNAVAVSWPRGTAIMKDDSEAKVWGSSSAAGLGNATLVPSAYTVQVMNTEPIQITSGILYAGRMKTQQSINGLATSVKAFSDNIIAYNTPRLMSAAKLSFRGVRSSAIPFNMSDLSDFLPVDPEWPAGSTNYTANPTGSDGTANRHLQQFKGFAPMFIINPTNVALEFLVTVECRLRFDSFTPAQASHKAYVAATEKTWSNTILKMEQHANGFVDIVESVARVGAVAQKGISAAAGYL
jgi:hypothetical protein